MRTKKRHTSTEMERDKNQYTSTDVMQNRESATSKSRAERPASFCAWANRGAFAPPFPPSPGRIGSEALNMHPTTELTTGRNSFISSGVSPDDKKQSLRSSAPPTSLERSAESTTTTTIESTAPERNRQEHGKELAFNWWKTLP